MNRSMRFGVLLGLAALVGFAESLIGGDSDEYSRKLSGVRILLKDRKQWPKPFEELQSCLECAEKVTVKAKRGDNYVVLPVRVEAEFIVQNLSLEERVSYQGFYENRAKELLLAAGKDEGKLKEVARRYPFTKPGAAAIEKLAVLQFDDGRTKEAAAMFVRWGEVVVDGYLPPPTLYVAAEPAAMLATPFIEIGSGKYSANMRHKGFNSATDLSPMKKWKENCRSRRKNLESRRPHAYCNQPASWDHGSRFENQSPLVKGVSIISLGRKPP